MYVYYQGSDGYIKTLGDDELAHYNHNHDALGRFAKSAGASIKRSFENDAARTVARKYEKINERQRKIDKYERKINSTRNQRRLYKAQKYKAKLAKAERKAKKARMRKEAGYRLTDKQAKRLMKVEKLKAKAAGKTYKTEKWSAKAQKREYKNYKDAKDINRLVNKYGDVAMSQVKSSERTRVVREYLDKSPSPIKRKSVYNQ